MVREEPVEVNYVVLIPHYSGRYKEHVNLHEGVFRMFDGHSCAQRAHGHAMDCEGKMYRLEPNGDLKLMEDHSAKIPRRGPVS